MLAAPRNCNWLTDKGTEGGHNAAANELREGLVDNDLFSILVACFDKENLRRDHNLMNVCINNLYNVNL